MLTTRLVDMRSCHRGYTLAELIVVVMFIGIMAAVAIPRIDFGIVRKHTAKSAAYKIITDLRRTRHLAIANASENRDGYRLSFTTIDGKPGYKLLDLSNGKTVNKLLLPDDVTCSGGTSFDFGPLGNLKAASPDSFEVTAGGKTVNISIVRATGTAKCSEE